MIIGNKVRLRTPEGARADHEAIVQWRNSPEIRQWFFSDDEITLESHLSGTPRCVPT